MPQRLDSATKERVLSLVREHLETHLNLNEASAAVARREGLYKQTVHRWAQQAGLDTTCPSSLGVLQEHTEDSGYVAGLALENRALRAQVETLQTAIRLLDLSSRPAST